MQDQAQRSQAREMPTSPPYLELHRDKACPGTGDQSVLYLSMAENSVGLSRFRNSQDQKVIIKKNHTIWLCVEN